MVDTNNAHIRQNQPKPTRNSLLNEANSYEALFNDPKFTGLLESQRAALIEELESFEHDGSPEAQNKQDEICRELRLWRRLRKTLRHKIDRTKLRAHQTPNDPNQPTDGD